MKFLTLTPLLSAHLSVPTTCPALSGQTFSSYARLFPLLKSYLEVMGSPVACTFLASVEAARFSPSL